MKINVYHCVNTRDSFFYDRNGKFFDQYNAMQDFLDGKYELVAQLDVQDRCEAYSRTQNIDEAWRPENPTRSSSIGDIFECSDTEELFVVARMGFDKIDFDEYFKYCRQKYLKKKT